MTLIQSTLGKVDKMQILVYDKPDSKSPKDTIYVQFNPDKYSLSVNTEFVKLEPQNSTNPQLIFNSKQSDKVSFEFLFDGTGVVPPGKIGSGSGTKSLFDTGISAAASLGIQVPFNTGGDTSISKDIESFKSLLSGYDGNTHDVPYLKLIWGDYLFQCRLTDMEIQFTLFNPQGRPLRAIAKCSFLSTETVKEMLTGKKANSPDMTHERVFTMGDKLTLMAENIYDSQDHYIDVARANALLSFRNIAVGSKIIFPPIK